MSPAEVLNAWKELTGETWRLVPYIVTTQAAEYAQAGFTREDLALVIRYTRAQIAEGESGYNAQSLTWRVLAADQWQRFQERLELARRASAAWRRRVNRDTPATPPLDRDDEAVRAAGVRRLRNFREGA